MANKIKWNYKTGRIAIYTLLILNIISFASFPESRAKYFTTRENALAFSADVYKLYKPNRIPSIDLTTKPSADALKFANFSFSFPRNEIGDFKISDEYEIVVPTGCTVQTINGRPMNGVRKVAFSPTSTTTKATVSLQCQVDKIVVVEDTGRKFLKFSVKIKEQVDGERQFDYTDKTFGSYPYDLYVANYYVPPVEEVPTILTIPKTDTDMYKTFITWIGKYAASTDYENEIKNYVEKHCPGGNMTDIINNKLPGIHVTEDTANNNYVFSISSNFIGYARQYSQGVDKFMYFSTTDVVELQAAFELYLKEGFLKDKPEPAKTELFNLIVSYVDTFDRGIAHLILDGGKIPGLQAVGGTDEGIRQVIVSSSIADYAWNKVNKRIRASFENEPTAMWGLVKTNLPIVYEENVISQDTIDNIPKLYPSIYISARQNNKNVSAAEKKSFNDYFIIDDKDHQIYMNIYSNVESDITDTYNYTRVSKIDYNNFVFSDSSSQFRVLAKEISTIREFVAALDVFYGKTTTLLDTDFLDDGYGMKYINYYTAATNQSTPVQKPDASEPEVEGSPDVSDGGDTSNDGSTTEDKDATVKDELSENENLKDDSSSLKNDASEEAVDEKKVNDSNLVNSSKDVALEKKNQIIEDSIN